jgi:hypothetical protein
MKLLPAILSFLFLAAACNESGFITSPWAALEIHATVPNRHPTFAGDGR